MNNGTIKFAINKVPMSHKIPPSLQFCKEFMEILELINSSAMKAFCQQRLDLLQQIFKMHILYLSNFRTISLHFITFH